MKTSCLFLTGLNPDITPEQVKEYVDQAVRVNSLCEKMNTRKSKYTSSFKVRVPTEVRDALMKEEMWGEGVTINHFLNLRERRSQRETQDPMKERTQTAVSR